MKNNQTRAKINKMLTEFSDQLGIDGKTKSNMGRNMAIAAAGVIGFSLIRRLMKGNNG